MEELKKLLEEQKRAFEEFKKENDKRIEEAKSGRSDPLAEEKLAKINAALDEAEKKHKARVDELETKLNRAQLGPHGESTETKKAREAKAAFFNGYVRKGLEQMSAEQKSLLVSADTTGGYLAPPDYVAEIIKAEVLFSPFRQIVRVRSTSAGQVSIPKRTGTASATRSGEQTTRGETQNPSWGLLNFGAPEMYAEARVSFADLEDSAFNLEQMLQEEFAEQFGVKEGAEIVSGSGINACLGFLDANAAGPGVPIAYSASGSAATIKGASGSEADGIIDLFHAVKTPYAVRGSWVLNRTSLGKVRKLKDTTGQYLWAPGLNGAAGATILGAPYVECPDMPDEGANAFPIAFGDWSRAYMLVDRVSMSVVRDPFTLADKGQVKFSARRRVGGQVVLGEAIRLLKCATS